MVDTISAPQHDRCAVEWCRRPESDQVHTSQRGHRFVRPEQIASRRPIDPLRDVRKMTDAERAAAQGSPRRLSEIAAGVTQQHKKEEHSKEMTTTKPDPNSGPKCAICDKTKYFHRGSIGHRFTTDPIAAAKFLAAQIAPDEPAPASTSEETSPSEPPPSNVEDDDFPALPPRPLPSSPPVITTRAMIVESIERAIAQIDIASDPIIRDFRLKVDVDLERAITTAEATVSLSLTFPRSKTA